MGYVTDEAVVLRVWDFSETSQTVSLFGRETGIVRGLAKGAKRERSSFAGGFEPLARGDITLIQRPTAELATLTEWRLRSVCHAARRRLRAHHLALYLVDLCDRSLSPADPHPGVFDALVAALASLSDDPAGDASSTVRFQLALLGESGYGPDLVVSSHPASAPLVFDATEGGLRQGAAAPGRWPVRRETAAAIASLGAGEPAPDETLWRGARLLHAYWSWQFRRELFSATLALGPITRAPARDGSPPANTTPSVDSDAMGSEDSAVAEPRRGALSSPTGGTTCRS